MEGKQDQCKSRREIKPGDRFVRLKAVCRIYTTDNYPTWLLECECGKLVVSNEQSLLEGYRVSCGCLPPRREYKPRQFVALCKDIPAKVYTAWKNAKRLGLLSGVWLNDPRRFYADVGDPPSPFSCLARKDKGRKLNKWNFVWGGKREMHKGIPGGAAQDES